MSVRKQKPVDKRMSPVERTMRTLRRLSRGPLAPEILAKELQFSPRQLSRFMTEATRAGMPLYLRRTPTSVKAHWWLDTNAFIAWLREPE